MKNTYEYSKNTDWEKRDEEILQKVREIVEAI